MQKSANNSYSPANNLQLFSDQVDKLYEHTAFGTAATLINGIILFIVLRAQADPFNLLVWIVGACAISAGRLILYWSYKRSPVRCDRPEKWNLWFNVTLFLSGVLWGSTAIFLFPPDSIGHQVFIAFVVGGMVAGAVSAFTAVLSSFFIFSLPALVPICIRLFTLSSEIHLAMGVMAVLFLVLVSMSATRMHQHILRLLALRYERTALVNHLQLEIAERKKAQEDLSRQKERVEETVAQRTAQLKNANQRLRAILNYAPLAIWAIDQKACITFIEGKSLKKIGISADTAMGRSLFELFSKNKPFIDITQRVLEGEFISETVSFDSAYFEVRYQPRVNEGDSSLGAIGVAIDVTEKTAAKEALLQSEEKYRDLVENINDVLYTIDPQGVITYISPVVERVMGYRAEEVTGKNFFDYIHHEDLERVNKNFDMALTTSGTLNEFRFNDKSGGTKWFRASSRPIENEDNQIIGIQGVLLDITWSKGLEEQLQRAQKMEALGTLAGGVAHDLNNILSGIVSYPELLLIDLPKDSPFQKPLNIIKKSGENAVAIVQDLMTLARRGVPNFELLNLNQIVNTCLDSPEIAAMIQRQPNVQTKIRLHSDLLNIYGSSIHIFTSLTNLILNATEAMPDGGVIEISTCNRYTDKALSGYDTVREGEYAVLTVTDTGIGISRSDQVRIFEPFYTKKIMGRSGSGLGMAVVWGTVKDHNGYIDIVSDEGEGAKFELYFPATRDCSKTKLSPETLSDMTGNGEIVLVVDDSSVQREIATEIVQRLGYHPESVASGEEAIEFVRHRQTDLIILDMIMEPGIDGYQTYREIIAICPGQKAIIASGYSETDRVRKTQALGAGTHIKKPYTLAGIGEAIRAELDRTP